MTATETTTMTALDVKALRQCHRAAFRQDKSGAGEIDCIRELDKRGPFDDTERRHQIVITSRVRDFQDTTNNSPRQCFELVYNFRHTPNTFATFAAFVRAGDCVELYWRASNNSETIRRAGLHVDELAVIVTRRGRQYLFSIETSICEDNSARMIRG